MAPITLLGPDDAEHVLSNKGRDPLTVGYLDDLFNGSPNKYEKILKIEEIL
jgi:hypothetical protein